MTHELLRFATAGSVDDGKSTLVGRLLHDSKSVLADTLAAIELASANRGLATADLALLTDGLRAEREQGITIDVAYRYFSTPARSFILADTPGHVQYTRNMVTGASTAELALVLVDARHGIVEQTRRHAAIAALLGIRHVVLVVNKMDLVGYSQERFTEIRDAFLSVATSLNLPDVHAIPVSALLGDNVVEPSTEMPWYTGPALLEFLETVPVGSNPHDDPFRMPVQYVNRPRTAEHPDFRGYSGRITSGAVSVGDVLAVQPGGSRSTVIGIERLGVPTEQAFAQQSVTILLADDLDINRGELLAAADESAVDSREIHAALCVVADTELAAGTRVLARFGTRTVRAVVGEIHDRLDLETLAHIPFNGPLAVNDVGLISLRLADDVAVDDYRRLRPTGSFILIDTQDGSTLAGGMVRLSHPTS